MDMPRPRASAISLNGEMTAFAHIRSTGLTGELGGRVSDPEFFGLLTILPDPDEVLRRTGLDQRAYRRILADEHVEAVVTQRASAVLRQSWEVNPGGDGAADQAAAEFFREVLEALPMQRVMEQMLTAPLWGLAAHEAIWARDGQRWFVERLPDRPARRIVFDGDGNPRLKTRSNPGNGEEIPPGKFLLTRFRASWQNPYGERLLSKIYWPHTFKMSGYQFWVTFLEKFGMPWSVISYPPGMSEEEVGKLVDIAEAAVQDAVLAVPAGSDAKLLETTGGRGDAHDRMIRACENGISKAIVGQTLTTQIGDKGSFAASKTHESVREDIVEMDARMVEETLNELGRWHTELNFSGATPPVFSLKAGAKPQMEWAKVLNISRKFLDVPKTWAHERLGIPMAEEGEDVLESGGSAPMPGNDPQFAEREGFAVESRAIPGMTDALAAKFAPALEAVEEALGRAVSEAEFIAALEVIATQEEPLAGEFAEALKNALLRATLQGRADA
ncbi:MAG: DUF935 family protein [Candidatus Glassbacteria bacterium]|nr:DUF935 family protein [Candidatus Glassbacteria bacterium]